MALAVPAGAITLEKFMAEVKSAHYAAKDSGEAGQSPRREDDGWLLKITPKAKHTETSIVQPGLPETSTTYGAETSLETQVESTGTKLRFTASSEYVDQTYGQVFILPQNGPGGALQQTPAPQGPRPNQPTAGNAPNLLLNPGGQYRTGVGIYITQPLIGGGGETRGEQARNRPIAGYRNEAKENAFRLEAAELFVDWALAGERENIAKTALKRMEEGARWIAGQAGKTAGMERDSLRMQSAAFSAAKNAAMAEAERKTAGAGLAALAGNQKILEDTPELDFYGKTALLAPAEAGRAAAMNLRAASGAVSDKGSAVNGGGVREGGKGPRLDLNLGGGVKGEDKEYGKSLDMDRREWSVSLAFAYPFGGGGSGQERSSPMGKGMSEDEMKASSSASMLAARISGMDKAMAISEELVRAAEGQTEIEERDYRQGKGSLTGWISAMERETSARIARAESAASRTRLKLRLDAAVGRFF